MLATRTMPSRSVAARPAKSSRAPRVAVRASADTMLVVSGATGLMLSAGRFAFLPFQRKTQEKAMLVTPKTTGTSWSDNLSKDATFVMKSGDPSGFNLIDVMGWGALGHAVGFAALGVASFQ